MVHYHYDIQLAEAYVMLFQIATYVRPTHCRLSQTGQKYNVSINWYLDLTTSIRNLLHVVCGHLKKHVLPYSNKCWRTNKHIPRLVEVVSEKENHDITNWTCPKRNIGWIWQFDTDLQYWRNWDLQSHFELNNITKPCYMDSLLSFLKNPCIMWNA